MYNANRFVLAVCSSYKTYFILHAALNISSDLMILCIPMSFLPKTGLHTKQYVTFIYYPMTSGASREYILTSLRKWALRAVFSLGIFVVGFFRPITCSAPSLPSEQGEHILTFNLELSQIIAAILGKYYSLTSDDGAIWADWYIRETGTGMLVGNLPFCWAAFRAVGLKIPHLLPASLKERLELRKMARETERNKSPLDHSSDRKYDDVVNDYSAKLTSQRMDGDTLISQ